MWKERNRDHIFKGRIKIETIGFSLIPKMTVAFVLDSKSVNLFWLDINLPPCSLKYEAFTHNVTSKRNDKVILWCFVWVLLRHMLVSYKITHAQHIKSTNSSIWVNEWCVQKREKDLWIECCKCYWSDVQTPTHILWARTIVPSFIRSVCRSVGIKASRIALNLNLYAYAYAQHTHTPLYLHTCM